MTAAVLYARYSTEMQSATSAEDQLRLLRERAGREGWTILAEQADRAISGTVRDRPGLTAALALIESGEAQILLAEAIDRISRDQEDIAAFYKRVRFAGGRIVTLAEGDIGSIHVGMGGTISAIFLEQLAEKTRRGQIGRAIAGRIPGGISYGYRAVRRLGPDGEPERGLRAIDEEQAAVIRRIFTDYADGISPIAIARALNAEGQPSPRGGLWRANAITGHRKRGNGILHNQLYIGRIVFNRQSFRKDPETRRRVARANDAATLTITEVPELRIIEPELWQRVQDRLALYADKPTSQTRRPKRLLSGLMRCGSCDGTVTVIGRDRWGCSNHFQAGTCKSGTTISDRQAQLRLFRAMQVELLHPDMIAAYIDEWRIAIEELQRDATARRARLEARLATIEAEDRRIVDAIVAGLPVEALRAKAEELAAERDSLRAQLAAQPMQLPKIHPGLADHYRRAVEQLHDIVGTDQTLAAHSRALIKDLIDRIEVHPRQGGRGADLVIHGQLAALLSIPNNNGPTMTGGADCMLSMVAGAGFEPATFRL